MIFGGFFYGAVVEVASSESIKKLTALRLLRTVIVVSKLSQW